MSDHIPPVLPLRITEAAAVRVKNLTKYKNQHGLKLRVYISGGGCSGFQYGFILDENINDDDIVIAKYGIELVVDPISAQYLVGGAVDYIEGLEGSRFIVQNPNASTTCSCGSSFSI